jgi:hypothetical protein
MRTHLPTLSTILMVAVMAAWLGGGVPPAAAKKPPAPVPETEQTQCWDAVGTPIPCAGTGQDGAIQAGVPVPTPRFTDHHDGTVTDNLTGLIWLQQADCFGSEAWTNALNAANTLASGACGLTDGSQAGTWRLPNIRELFSLIDFGAAFPALPAGHPFAGVQSNFYWSSTTRGDFPGDVWIVDLSDGLIGDGSKGRTTSLVWPVRGGL